MIILLLPSVMTKIRAGRLFMHTALNATLKFKLRSERLDRVLLNLARSVSVSLDLPLYFKPLFTSILFRIDIYS